MNVHVTCAEPADDAFVHAPGLIAAVVYAEVRSAAIAENEPPLPVPAPPEWVAALNAFGVVGDVIVELPDVTRSEYVTIGWQPVWTGV